MWKSKRDDFVEQPRFKTRSQMNDYRKASMLPHYSFDVDGDGVVSSEDFALAQAFDINKDGALRPHGCSKSLWYAAPSCGRELMGDGLGVLDDEERHELRKEMVATLVSKYRRLPCVHRGTSLLNHLSVESKTHLHASNTRITDRLLSGRRCVLQTLELGGVRGVDPEVHQGHRRDSAGGCRSERARGEGGQWEKGARRGSQRRMETERERSARLG